MEGLQPVLPVISVPLDGINQMKPTSGVYHVELVQPPCQRVHKMRTNAVSTFLPKIHMTDFVIGVINKNYIYIFYPSRCNLHIFLITT